MPGAVFLEGEEVNLRTIEEEDLDFLVENINNSEIRPWVTHRGPANLEQEEKFFREEISSDIDTSYFLICQEQKPVGFISLEEKWKDSRLAQIEFWVTPEEQGKGYGTEGAKLVVDYAFDELNMHKILVLIAGNNPASQEVWEKLGFNREGNLKSAIYIKGEHRDVKYFGITEGEWREN